MGRFNGWTMAHVLKLSNDLDIKIIEEHKKTKVKKKYKNHVKDILNALDCQNIKYVTEYRFREDRRFRFDIAIPESNIAIEFDGGIWTGGRHTRAKGFHNDRKKSNLAVQHGWKLLYYTTTDTKKLNWEFKTAEEIKDLIKNSKQKG